VWAGEWPWAAVITTGLSLAAAAGAVGKRLWDWAKKSDQLDSDIHRQGWAEVATRDKAIDALRVQLDRQRGLRNAYGTALELSLLAMKMSPAVQAELILRIEAILRPLPSSSKGDG
jgi:hypothetical protein